LTPLIPHCGYFSGRLYFADRGRLRKIRRSSPQCLSSLSDPSVEVELEFFVAGHPSPVLTLSLIFLSLVSLLASDFSPAVCCCPLASLAWRCPFASSAFVVFRFSPIFTAYVSDVDAGYPVSSLRLRGILMCLALFFCALFSFLYTVRVVSVSVSSRVLGFLWCLLSPHAVPPVRLCHCSFDASGLPRGSYSFFFLFR